MEEIINEFEEFCRNLAISGDSPSAETIKEYFDRYAQTLKLQKTAVIRCCSNCSNYRHEEIGDSDYGAVYADEASCSKYYDTDEETEEVISGFDRNIERECCALDFFKVCEIDTDLSDRLAIEMDETHGGFSETYRLFKVRYNNE